MCRVRVVIILQGVGEELVHLGDASRDGKVNGTVTDLDDETANNVGVDLGMLVTGKGFHKEQSRERGVGVLR